MKTGARTNRSKFSCVAGLLIAALIAISSDTASANTYGGSPFGVPDSSDHWWCYGNINYDHYRFWWGMDHLDQATNMYQVQSSYCGSLTDVVFYYGQSPTVPGWLQPSTYGHTDCAVWIVFLGPCEQYNVYIDDNNIWSYSGGDVNLWDFNMYVAITHEVGHTAGLQHTSGVEVMTPGPWQWWEMYGTLDWNYANFSAHDICHVNQYLAGSSC